MHINSRIILASTTLLVLVSMAACSPRSTGLDVAAVKDPAVATVNGIDIPASRLALVMKQSVGQRRVAASDARKTLVDSLVMQTLLAEDAKKSGLDKDPEVMQQLELTRQSVLSTALARSIQNTEPSPEVIQAAYEKLKNDSKAQEYKVRQIVVATQPEAMEIIARINAKPQDFGAVAKAKSVDKESGAKEGDIGWIDAKAVVPLFGEAIKSLEPGKVSQAPLKSQFGYHILRVDEVRQKEPPSIETARGPLTQQIKTQRLKAYIDALKTKAKIVIAAAPAVATKPAAAAPSPAR
jgi:peptidyl-prolyl cis-trans isomerase C